MDGFAYLPCVFQILSKKNLNSVIKLWEDEGRFSGMHVQLASQNQVITSCQKDFSIDVARLKY